MEPLPIQDQETLLIARIVNGSSIEYKVLYDAHVQHLFRFLKQFRRNDNDVQELVQRAFIKAYEGLPSFNGRSKFKTWLFRIALNEMNADHRRSAIIDFVGTDDTEELAGDSGSNQLEWNSTLRTVFERLDDLKKSVFILYEVEGYSHREISFMLSIGESASRTILTRTKQWLRAQLQERTRTR